MRKEIACDALIQGKRLKLSYDGLERIVEVHAVGLNKQRQEVMFVWQVRGGSESGEQTGWKLLMLDKVSLMQVTDEKSTAVRGAKNTSISTMTHVYCEI
ncbi:hypothetical protein [Pannonibacter sp. SL95]|uniref:hypothetical protein n=1 Tax=Pannonibacter sp. SL95 TaxID=2995153 RepID=UPI00227472CA|nr:hypothetical protein [Pannonibacter sp. SL95]MCY1705846.1 hypothetical protein [Pannonibacter sp. SL95]